MLSFRVAILSLLAAFLYSRSSVLYRFYANSPGRLKRVQNLKNADIKFPDILSNCEDVVLDTDQGFAILSCDKGRDTWNTVMGTFSNPQTTPETGLFIWHYADTSTASSPEKLELIDFTEDRDHFHPLGIDYHAASQTLFVINHSLRESYLEVFKLSPSEKAAVHQRRVKHALLAAPNSVIAVSAHELFVTNDHYFLRRNGQILPTIETYLTIPGGSVVFVDLHSRPEPTVRTLARVSFANGIAQLNESSLAVASTNMNSVYIYNIMFHNDGKTMYIRHTKTISVPFHPDNLSVDQDGRLLIAGHPHSPTLDRMIKKFPICRQPGAENPEGCVKGPSWIAEWSDQGGLKTLYAGDWYGTSTTAVRDIGRSMGMATGLYERGILVWTES